MRTPAFCEHSHCAGSLCVTFRIGPIDNGLFRNLVVPSRHVAFAATPDQIMIATDAKSGRQVLAGLARWAPVIRDFDWANSPLGSIDSDAFLYNDAFACMDLRGWKDLTDFRDERWNLRGELRIPL